MALIKPRSDVVRGVPMSRLEAHARKICFPNVPSCGPCAGQKMKAACPGVARLSRMLLRGVRIGGE